MRRPVEFIRILSERWFPLIGSTAATAVYAIYHAQLPLRSNINDLLLGSLNVAAIGTGFLIAAKAILLSISNSRVIRKLKDSGHFRQVIEYFIRASWLSGMAALVSASLLWVDFDRLSTGKQELTMLLWIFFCCYGILTSIRAVYFFGRLVKASASE